MITQFFKNPASNDTQKNSTPKKDKDFPAVNLDTHSALKRKIISPTHTNSDNEILEISQTSPTKSTSKKLKAIKNNNEMVKVFNKENKNKGFTKSTEETRKVDQLKETLIITEEDLNDKNINIHNSPIKKVLNENYERVTKIQSPKKTLHFDNTLSPSKGGNVTPKKYCKGSFIFSVTHLFYLLTFIFIIVPFSFLFIFVRYTFVFSFSFWKS